VRLEPERRCERHSIVRAAMALCVITFIASACATHTTFTAGKPAVRVLAKTGCPKTIAGYHDVTNSRNARSSTLLPPSAPMGVLSCVYDSAHDGRKLERALTRPAAQARSLATVINRIHLGYDTRAHTCPPSTGLVTIFAFTYEGNPDVDLWWLRDGCQSLDNGSHIGFEVGNPSFYKGFMGEVQRLRP
jgi:hypothetical protein